MNSRHFIAFAVIFVHDTIFFPALGQSTVQGYDIGDSSINIVAEIQQLRLILEAFGQQVQGLQKLQDASFQEMSGQHHIITRSLQAVDRRLNDHDIHIKNKTDISMSSLHVVDRCLHEHDFSIKNQTDVIERSLLTFDRRLNEHDVYIKNQTDISLRNLQVVDRRLHEHDVNIKNQTDVIVRSLLTFDRRLNEHDIYIKNQTESSMRSLQSIDRRLIDHDIRIHNQTQNFRKLANDVCRRPESPVIDCSDIRANGHNESGVYQVYVRNLRQYSINAFCDMETTNGNWLVFQRRKDSSENFYRTWNEYAAGFGDPSGEFWLGNDMLHFFTTKRNYKLRIDLEDFEGQRRYAEYSRFFIESSADNYTLTVGNYSGNAGDSLSYHNGMQFSTKDADHDIDFGKSCAQYHNGAWWYKSCYTSNLNGIYRRGNYSTTKYDGVTWNSWHGYQYSLKITEMKLAPMP